VKPALRGLLVLVVAMVATQAGAAAPSRLLTIPYSAAFWSPNDGLLAVGLCATDRWSCGTGAVELTTDGGRTYHVVFRTRRPVESVQTVGPGGAIVTSFSRRSWRTLDGGRTWSPWLRGPFVGLSFATPRLGFGYRFYERGNQSYIELSATNDGATWTRLRAPCDAAGLLLDRVTAGLGWILCGGEPGAGNESKELFRTRDGGRTWQRLAHTAMTQGLVRGGISSLGYPAGMSFAANGFGLMWESRGTLYVTRDGGRSWKARSRFAAFDVDFGLGGAAFAGGTGYVLYSHDGVSYRLIGTRDYGRTWRIVRSWKR